MPVSETPPLAQVYRRFSQAKDVKTSPLYEQIAVALSESDEALRAIESAPPSKRRPALILAALHDLALAGRAPTLAAAYATADGDAAADAAIDTVVRLTDAVVTTAVRRSVLADETGRYAVLYPAIADAAHRTGAEAVGLIDVGWPAAINLNVDRVGITYSNGQRLGDPNSPVQLSASVVGNQLLPMQGMPMVVARVGIDRAPVDVADPDDTRWLRACVPPDRTEQRAMLDAELAVAAADPPLMLAGGVVEMLSEALARVPGDALPLVMTTWALSKLTPEHRQRFVDQLSAAAAARPVAWVSVEGVGVAPAIPTLGDRPASGHSIIGLTVLDRLARSAEALGRCWSRGRLLSWF